MRSVSELALSYEDATRYVRDHECTCGGQLVLATTPKEGRAELIIKCGRDGAHDQWKRIRGGWLPMESKALQLLDQKQMVARIDQARFPQALTPQEKQLLATVARSYGLDPLMGELSIYQGRPFVGIEGRYRKAQETGRLDGVDTRPATKQERADWEIPDGDYFFRSEVYVKGATHAFVGWGRVRGAERKSDGSFRPVDTNPQRMAEKRAEAQALRKAFHIPLPSAEDIGTPENDNPTVVNCRVIDQETGEVKESEATASPQARTGAKPPDAVQTTTQAENAAETRGNCPVHGVPFVHHQGIAKKGANIGKPYDFWSCPDKLGDGSYCQEKPASQHAATPESDPQGQGEPLDQARLLVESQAAQDAARQFDAMKSAAPAAALAGPPRATEAMLSAIGKLCDQLGRLRPSNLSTMTMEEAAQFNEQLLAERKAKGGAK